MKITAILFFILSLLVFIIFAARELPEEPLNEQKTAIPLPEIQINETFSLGKSLWERKSTRNYLNRPLSIFEISQLLWAAIGKTSSGNRLTVPSAGARHAYETYLLINKVEGLEDGLYRFQATKHKLIKLETTPDIAEKITEACLMQRFVMASAVTFIWVAVQYRMTWRYQERGYRYLNLDAGHICQNLYLAGEAIACGTCAIGAYDDNQINTLLGLNGIDEFVVYIASTGKKK